MKKMKNNLKKKAEAVKYNDKEASKIAKEIKAKNAKIVEQSKLPYKLNDQKDYRAKFLTLMLNKAELDFLQGQIEKGNNGNKLDMQYSGIECPLPIAVANYNIKLHNYKMILSEYLKLEEKIKKEYKYSDEQLKDVRENGNWIKE